MAELPLLIFDVNETLLDIEAVTPLFVRIFGDPSALRTWFAQMILYSEALTLAGDYTPFGELGGAVLKMVAATRGKEVTSDDLSELKQSIATMPPHPDVEPSLRRLREAGFRLFAFSNNPLSTLEKQLEHARLSELFERAFSVDERVRRFKPAPESYVDVANELSHPPKKLCLVACHTWDTLGAVAAGWEAALIRRKGNAPLEVGPQPTIVGADLAEVADALIHRHKSGLLAKVFGVG